MRARAKSLRRSPGRSRICALQELHLREEMAEMLGVPAAASAALHPPRCRARQRRLGEHASDAALPFGLEQCRVDGEALSDQRLLDGVALEHLAGIGPELVERGLGAAMALRRAVAEADQPFAGMAQVIGGLLLGLGGDRRQRRIARARERAPEGMYEGGIEELPDDGDGEIAVGLLDQQDVAEIVGVAQIGERILVAALALDRAGISVERARLADEVERDIAQRQLLLEQRRMADPFREAVAEDERVVGEPQRVREEGRGGHWCGISIVRPSTAASRRSG